MSASGIGDRGDKSSVFDTALARDGEQTHETHGETAPDRGFLNGNRCAIVRSELWKRPSIADPMAGSPNRRMIINAYSPDPGEARIDWLSADNEHAARRKLRRKRFASQAQRKASTVVCR